MHGQVKVVRDQKWKRGKREHALAAVDVLDDAMPKQVLSVIAAAGVVVSS